MTLLVTVSMLFSSVPAAVTQNKATQNLTAGAAHDFAVTAITSPVSGTGSGSIIPAATVQNLGTNQ